VNDSFNGGTSLGSGWQARGGDWRLSNEPDSGGYASQLGAGLNETFLTNRLTLPADIRAEADLRLADGRAAGVVVRYQDQKNYAAAWLDRDANALVTNVVAGGRSSRQSTPLPATFEIGDWHNLAVEVRGSQMTAEVTDARLHDPYAVAGRTLPASLSGGKMGVAARGRADADNASAVALYTPNTLTAATPEAGALSRAYSDEFDRASLGPKWSWVRTPVGEVSGGAYRWPVQEGDIVGTGNNASLLLRDAPQGNYVVETRLTIDLGVDTVLNYQQGGIVAYDNDDLWTRLSHVAIWNTRQTEFGKEMPFADGLSFGGMLIGPPDQTTYLRLAHSVDPVNGEHEFRAATSRDGEHWIWGGTWTLPAGTEPRIGLLALGKSPNDPAATAVFDYFRVYR
jgi:arabinan endo-1,5-alpha-L-arabinosidase